jgi:conjugal transfer/entry exclusion protein
MDLKIREDIQFHAVSVFSENIVTARRRIDAMNAQLRDPATDLATKAALHNNLQGSIQAYDSFRIKQAKKKQEVLEALYAKYSGLDKGDIQRFLDATINTYEMDHK